MSELNNLINRSGEVSADSKTLRNSRATFYCLVPPPSTRTARDWTSGIPLLNSNSLRRASATPIKALPCIILCRLRRYNSSVFTLGGISSQRKHKRCEGSSLGDIYHYWCLAYCRRSALPEPFSPRGLSWWWKWGTT